MADRDIYNTTASTGKPMRGLSTERTLEIIDGLKQYDEERGTFFRLAGNRDEPVIKGLPLASEPQPIFGFPVHVSAAMPLGYGMAQTACHCGWNEIERDGGSLMHVATHHTVIVKFNADA